MSCVESDFSMMHDEESDFENDDVFDENPAPGKKGSRLSSNGLSVLSPNQNKANIPIAAKNGKTIESQYRKLSQREHCLVRPDTYIGSIEPITDSMFVLDEAMERLVSREITYTPGLYKIFDESKYLDSLNLHSFARAPTLHFYLVLVVVNAADNKQRDENMDKLDIIVDPILLVAD